MTRLEAIKASPLGYARRQKLMATTHSLFIEGDDAILRPTVWSPGMAGATDWEPVLPVIPKPVQPVENEPIEKPIRLKPGRESKRAR